MIDSLVKFALKNQLLVIVAAISLGVGGYYSFRQLPVDAFPDATPTLVQIYTSSEGLSPEDVETLISYPLEISMFGLPNLERIQSTSIFGLSRVDIYFEDGTDIYFARRLVLERLTDARRQIPPGLGEPELGPITTGLGRILMYTLEGDNYSLMEKRTIQDWIVKPQLGTVPGVTGVLSIGGFVKQYQVNVDINALLARDLSIADIERALVQNNRNVGASFIERGGEEYIVRGFGWLEPNEAGLRDIGKIIITEQGGTAVYIDDVADVELGAAIRRGAQIANGEESAGGYVFKLVGTNTQQVLEDVQAKIEDINSSLPEGLSLEAFYSQSDLVDRAIGTVEQSLAVGAILVLLILYILMGNLRSTLIVITSVPIAVLIAFIAMRFAGLSANLMSLGGLAIGIGMMVDGSIVVVENVYRHLEERKNEDVSLMRLVSEASREVARPIVFAVAIVIIVFLPLFTLQGVEGKMFSPMAYSISFALGGALLVALTVVPVLSTLTLTRASSSQEPRIVIWLKNAYRPLLNKTYEWPKAVFSSTVLFFILCLAIFPFLGTEFVPTLREGTFQVRSTLPPGASLPSAIEYGKRIQSIFQDYPEVTGTYSRVGRAEVGGDPEPVNVVATVVTLKPLSDWNSGRNYEALQSAMAERVREELPGLANNFSQPIQLRTDELLSGVQAQLVASIYGDDLQELETVGQAVQSIAETVDGATDVRTQQQAGKRQVVVTPDRNALARYGITIDEVMSTLSAGVGGKSAGQIFEGIQRFDIFMRLQENARNRLDLIEDLPIRTISGAIIPLARVANIELYTGPKQISRSNASRRLYVQMNVRGRDMGSVVEELRQRIADEIDMPPGYFVEFGGQFENQERAMQRLYLVVPVTLALIFLMLFSAFSSLRYASLIFLNVPFAVTGGILALWWSGLYLSVPAAVGFIAVFGVAVQNGVVMVSYINQLRERGYELKDAILTGSERRLRPVLMTALTAILGLLPLFLADGIGSNVQRPLAAVVIGGLITATLLTLLVLPAVYRWFAQPIENVEI
ncbi:MAG: CusA/CzcA family heavy metal efflux RND transporter [Gammaproteobacteria bacterium]